MPDNPLKSYFVSDLHLFSRRSSAPKLDKQLQQAVEQSHTFVLGGDIFDFRWSTQLSLGHAIDDSVQWLSRLIDLNRNCQFHYLLGNHDCHPDFVAQVEQLAQTRPEFNWHHHLLRIEDAVFLHGDIVDAKIAEGDDFHRTLDAKRLAGELRDPPTALSHALYDVAVKARVHRLVVQLAKPNELVLRRLMRYLDYHNLNPQSGVSHVYFGHTHRRMMGVPYAGMRFSNPGAAIKGLPFHLIELHLPQRSSDSVPPQSQAGNH